MAISNTKVENWALSEFADANNIDSDFDAFIKLPRFQRSLVWSEKQQAGLIDSIYRGYPIGALLAYQAETRDNKVILQMVDGLQRMTALRTYLEKPLYFAPVDILFSPELIDTVCQIKYKQIDDDNRSLTVNDIQKWLQSTKIAEQDSGWTFNEFKKSIAGSNAELALQIAEIEKLVLKEITAADKKLTKIAHSQIPVIKYQGPIGNIPTIFERINNQGTKLSKYEIFASSWINSAVLIESQKVQKAIREKYNVQINAGYVISDYEPNAVIPDDGYNLFEYLFGLGKNLAEEYPLLFSAGNDADDVTPIAFVMFTIALGMPLGEMDKLEERIPANDKKIIDPSALEKALRDSVEQINQKLKPILKLKLNSQSDKRPLPHSQNQIISLVTSYLVNAYDTETWKKRNTNSAKNILDSAASHYLFDILRNVWRGSGDSRLFRMTWSDDGKSPSSYYTASVGKEEFRDALNSWFNDSLKRNQTERGSISSSTRALLLFLYAPRVTVYADADDQYEIEHIYPVGHIAEIIGEGEEGWPISALGNLMLLPKTVNRIKGKYLLGDVLPELIDDGTISKNEVEKIQNYLIEPSDWHGIKDEPKITRDEFLDFCTKRHDAIERELVKHLHLTSES